MKNKFNINKFSEFQNLQFSNSEAFNISLNALAFLLNFISGLRAFHILVPLIQILNASSVSYFETESMISCVMIMAVNDIFEVGPYICR